MELRMADEPSLAPFDENDMRPPGVKDVAAHAGVSIGTVSNVLNHPHLVSPTLRERVRASIAKLDYVPNAAARQLRIGALASDGDDRLTNTDQASPHTRSKS